MRKFKAAILSVAPHQIDYVFTPEQLQENCRVAALGPLPSDLLKQISETVPLLPERLIRPKLWNNK